MKFPSLTFGLAVLLLAGFIVGLARGASRDDAKNKSDDSVFEFNKKEPIYITSDWMEVDQKKNTITYKGRVVTIQSEMTMRSETLIAVYDPEMKQIRQIIAEGKVNAVQGKRMATGDKAIFDEKAKTVTLTGNPVMRQGNSQVTGSRIIYYIDQDRAVAEGKDSVRVQVTIFPDELQKERDGKSEAGSSTAK
ncbi:MAG TPA: lipopolysaccharide transport periplasmic protein LptA [Candidatus Binatia bacterium]